MMRCAPGVRVSGCRWRKKLTDTAASKGTLAMKKIFIVIISVWLAPGLSFGAARIYVSNQGATGWQTYTYTAGPKGFTGTAGFVVSNVIDNSAYSELFLDNLSQGGGGANQGFELCNLTGYVLASDSSGTSFATVSTSAMAINGNTYTPTQGDFLVVIQGLSSGVPTSGFRNATGQIGTVGSILETAITLAPGEKFSFDWAFMGNDSIPCNDFALFYLKDLQSGAIVFKEVLAQISPPRVPGAVILLLLGEGSF
jgi:hypothetical protein